MRALTIADINREWLSRAMNREVTDFSVTALDEGYTSQVYRLGLSGEGLPASVIVKLAATSDAGRALADRFQAADKETDFYAGLQQQVHIQTPRCYYVDHDAFALVLEDLDTDDKTSTIETANPEQTLYAMQTLAMLHATPVTSFASLKSFDSAFTAAAEDWQSFISVLLQQRDDTTTNRFLQHYAAHSLAYLPRFDELEHVFSHMDFRLANMRWRDNRPCLFDWGEYCLAPIGFDIAYFLSTSLDVTDRRRMEHEALSHYLATLQAQGLENIGEAALFDAYRLCLPACYYLPALVLSRGDDMAEGRLLEARCVAAIEDHLPFLKEKMGPV